MMKLSGEQNKLHKRAVKLAKIHSTAERVLVKTLIEVEAQRVHQALARKSMFVYATLKLKLSDATALMLNVGARKSIEVPLLRKAVAEGKLTPSKASLIVAHINLENAEETLNFAVNHTYKEIDFEMAKRNPQASAKDRVKPLSENAVQATMTLSMNGFKDLERAQSLMAQRNKNSAMGPTVEVALTLLLNTQDPVRKAKRASAKKVWVHREKSEGAYSEGEAQMYSRAPLTAAQKHAVYLRDEGRCTHANPDGHRCNSDRWVQIHHIIQVQYGGTNEPDNLTTLCSFHHDLVHQLSFGLEGNINRIR